MMVRTSLVRVVRVRLLSALLAGLSVAVLGACGGSLTTSSPSPTADAGVVARVDGEQVTQAQVDEIQAEARLSGRGDSTDAARGEAVRRTLVLREAERLGVSVGDAAVRRRVSEVERIAGGAEALDAALARASMTRAEFDHAIRYSLLAAALADVKYADTMISSAAVRAFYDRHRGDLYTKSASLRLAQITVPGQKLAEKLVRRLRRGADFAETARQYSMDPQTRYVGGEVGWVSAFTVPPQVLTAVQHVASGAVADPVRSSGKWQIFKVLAKRPARILPFAEAREAIARELTRRRRAAALQDWIAAERKRASIELLP
jgi:parvulin-like peptidyl-prolyl isomerase